MGRLFVFLVQKLSKNRKSRVDLLFGATAIATLKGFAALGAKSGAILGAKYLTGEIKEERFSKLLVDIESSVFNDNVLVNVVLDLFLGKGTLVGYHSFKIKHEFALYGIKTPIALGLIRKLSLSLQLHVTCTVGDLSDNVSVVLEADSVHGDGFKLVLKGYSVFLSPEKRTYVQYHTKTTLHQDIKRDFNYYT